MISLGDEDVWETGQAGEVRWLYLVPDLKLRTTQYRITYCSFCASLPYLL